MSAQVISSDRSRIVIGLGKTGLSCARWLHQAGLPFRIVDTRTNPPGLAELQAVCPGIDVICGPLDAELLCQADELIVSPGLSLKEPAIAKAIAAGVQVIGDIELFCREVTAPIIAITGSNGKSTVTTLVGLMAAQAGVDVGVGGNIGTPVLDMLLAIQEQGEQELYVLELSSFQLETTYSLQAVTATILNITPDHMDRYDNSIVAYHRAKQRIYHGCHGLVFNRDDPLTTALVPAKTKILSFGTGVPHNLEDFGLMEADGVQWLMCGMEKLLPVSALKVCGLHNYTNALAALALGSLAGLPMAAMLDALTQFTGLPHRCEWVTSNNGVVWINDSKATNTGATVAAIDGLGAELQGKIVLIAGGDGKGASFDDLKPSVQRYVRAVIVLGKDGPRLAKTLQNIVAIHTVSDMGTAVSKAAEVANAGDIVLLAPACASLDMYNSFEHRGQIFCQHVNKYVENLHG